VVSTENCNSSRPFFWSTGGYFSYKVLRIVDFCRLKHGPRRALLVPSSAGFALAACARFWLHTKQIVSHLLPKADICDAFAFFMRFLFRASLLGGTSSSASRTTPSRLGPFLPPPDRTRPDPLVAQCVDFEFMMLSLQMDTTSCPSFSHCKTLYLFLVYRSFSIIACLTCRGNENHHQSSRFTDLEHWTKRCEIK
jgi:hypothetical protein